MITVMSIYYPSDSEALRTEIAIAAARMIVEEGADYGNAKRRAARQILGDGKLRGDFLPDNAQVENEVRTHHALFFSDTQPARLLHLRRLALELMEQLAAFSPYLTGAVQNGTAGEHSDIHLQLFTDSSKEVSVFLMDRNLRFEVSESPHFKGCAEPVEMLSFLCQRESVHLAVYAVDDFRGALKAGASGKVNRSDAVGLRKMIQQSATEKDVPCSQA